MKRSIIILMTVLLTTLMVNAQDAAAPAAVIVAEEEVFDFKDIKEVEGTVTHTFVVQNTGDAPLVITKVLPTCGCTSPDWTKDPIAKGGKGEIKVTFDPNGRPGPFNKTVNVFSNGKRGALVLIIKGNVT
ncbi:MAG: DUF1573 domain-containing protein [Tannerellaceae bacterium]|jgi:hypothetical protein|nr:DUF1573 domain-containing protein [Tannerellaceae bacterium]